MADISGLGSLKPVEPLNLSNYADVKERTFQLPKAGRHTLQAPPTFPPTAFSRTKTSGALAARIDPKILGGDNDGFEVRYASVFATTYKRDGQTVSSAGDYLRACGYDGTLETEQDIADAIEGTAGTTYDARLDWEARNNRTGFKVRGMKNFPKLADGNYQPWVEDPNDYETDEAGNVKVGSDGSKLHKRIRANVIIDAFYPRS